MRFTYTEDLKLVQWILTNPRAYAQMRHDALPEPQDFRVEPLPGVQWVIGWTKDSDGTEIPVAAFMIARKKQRVTLHFCMTPRVWGVAHAVGQRFINWLWRFKHGLREIVAAVPSHNALAFRVAQQCGLVFSHRGGVAGTKDGVPFELLWMSMKRPKEFA